MQYLDYKGIKKSVFYTDTGVSNGVLSQKNGISEDNLMRFLNFYSEISPEWLLTGKGEMLKTDKANQVPSAVPIYNNKGIPLLPHDAFAGIGDEYMQSVAFNTIEERYVIPLFKDIHIDFMIPVRGSSMYPRFSSGDVVACRLITNTLYIQWNKIYAIDTISQGVMIKRINKGPTEDTYTFVSDNEKYAPFVVPCADIRTLALVVGSVRID